MSASHWDEVRQALKLPPVPDDILQQAFQHGSYVRELAMDPVLSNQRLEFLGDAVLDLIVADELYRNHPDLHEGILTKTKASAVRAGALSKLALRMDLGRFLLLGRGEDESGGRSKHSILADTLEALLGAVYIACGLEATRDFLLPYLDLHLNSSEPGFTQFDHKTLLQELVQSRTRQLPVYTVTGTSGPAHSLSFTVQVRFGKRVIGTGAGASKRKAEQAAAREALEHREEWLPTPPPPPEPTEETADDAVAPAADAEAAPAVETPDTSADSGTAEETAAEHAAPADAPSEAEAAVEAPALVVAAEADEPAVAQPAPAAADDSSPAAPPAPDPEAQ